MSEVVPSQDQNHDQTAAILPGSRWVQRAYGGHVEQTVTVLRVGARSVMLVIEGVGARTGGAGHNRQKVGQRFNVVTSEFLRTHSLLSQPNGYTAGDEALPNAPKTDTLGAYFRRRRLAREITDDLTGGSISQAVGLPPFGDPPFVDLNDPAWSSTQHAQAQTTPEKEHQPMAEENVIATHEADLDTGEAGVVVKPTPEQAAALEPNLDSDVDEAEAAHPLGYTTAVPLDLIKVPATSTFAELEHPDPLGVFLEAGRVAIAELTEDLTANEKLRDDHLSAAEALDAKCRRIEQTRDRIQIGVTAAVDAIKVAEPEAPRPKPEAPQAPQPDRGDRGDRGWTYALPPDDGSQRWWVMHRLLTDGRIQVSAVAGEFSARFGMSRKDALKRVSSVLAEQLSHNPRAASQWPLTTRVDVGHYVPAN